MKQKQKIKIKLNKDAKEFKPRYKYDQELEERYKEESDIIIRLILDEKKN
jgi:hypothetical protein